jgi:hypothetical protein
MVRILRSSKKTSVFVKHQKSALSHMDNANKANRALKNACRVGKNAFLKKSRVLSCRIPFYLPTHIIRSSRAITK